MSDNQEFTPELTLTPDAAQAQAVPTLTLDPQQEMSQAQADAAAQQDGVGPALCQIKAVAETRQHIQLCAGDAPH